MEFHRQAILDSFMAETEEGLADMEQALVSLEECPDDQELVQRVFRIVHTLKGNALALGFESLSRFGHAIEDLLDGLRSGALTLTTATAGLLLRCVDILRKAVAGAVVGDADVIPQHSDVYDALRAALTGSLRSSTPSVRQDRGGAAPQRRDFAAGGQTLRVSMDKLDRMLNLTGEAGIAQVRMRQVLDRAETLDRETLAEAFGDLDRLLLELQEQVMAVRMVPIAPVLRRLSRVARDLATERRKRVQLVVEGDDASVDATIIEQIRDPLVHMIRNSVDHGIELPADRARAGKPSVGSIKLRALNVAGTIAIQVSDDGAGLNRPGIAERARKMGLAADPERMPDSELFRLIFESGFTTANKVTDVSGRGVGMDVVRRNVESLHGHIEVESVAGKGCTFTVRLPLTLAILTGFRVAASGTDYIVPLDAVVECTDLAAYRIDGQSGTGVIDFRGSAMPFFRLSTLFETAPCVSEREKVVVIRNGQQTLGMVVDDVYGEHQAVIKPLGKVFQKVAAVQGGTILGDGSVALVLDVPAVCREVLRTVSVQAAAQ